MDCLVGTGNGLVEHFKRIGTSWTQVSGNFFVIDVGAYANPFCVDIDEDGDIDCLVGNSNGYVYLFEQTGPAQFYLVANNYFGGAVHSQARPVCVDLDFDGRLECLVGSSSRYVTLFRNTGGPGEVQWSTASTDFFDHSFGWNGRIAPYCMDWRRDGRMDCVVGDYHGLTHHFQQGDPSGVRYTQEVRNLFGGSSYYSYSPMCTDLHGDGQLGCLFGDQVGHVNYFGHSGAPGMDGFTSFSTNLLGDDVGSYAAPFCFDMDGDGDKDCLVGNSNGLVYHYRNNGFLWTRTSTNFFSYDVGQRAKPNCADFDNDGDIDCLVGESTGKVVYFRNDGSSWTLVTVDFFQYDVGSNAAPACWDVDSDGDLDCLVGANDGSTFYFRNDGNASEPSWVVSDTSYFPKSGNDNSPFCVDLDNDGDVDCIVGQYYGAVLTFMNHQNWSKAVGRTGLFCPKGTYRNGDVCERCAAGRHASRGGSCTACPEGTYSDGGLSPCLQLPSDWLAQHAGAEFFNMTASHDSAGIVKVRLTVPTLPLPEQLYGNVTMFYRADMQLDRGAHRMNSSCGDEWHYDLPVVEILYPSSQASSSCVLNQSIEDDHVVVGGSIAVFLMVSDAGERIGRQRDWPIAINFTREVTTHVRLDLLEPVQMQGVTHTVDNIRARLQLFRDEFSQPVHVPVFVEGESIFVQCDAEMTQAFMVTLQRAWLTSSKSGSPVLVVDISETLEPMEAPSSMVRFKFLAVACEDCELHVVAQIQPHSRRLREVPHGRVTSGAHTRHVRTPFQIESRSSDTSLRLQGSLDIDVTNPDNFVQDPRVKTAAVTALQRLTAEPHVVVVMVALPWRGPGKANVRVIYNILQPSADTSTVKTLASIPVKDFAYLLRRGLQEVGMTGASLLRVTQHQRPRALLAPAFPDAVGEQAGDKVLPTALGGVALLVSTCGLGSLWTLSLRARRLKVAH